jgi:hypothetical protein
MMPRNSEEKLLTCPKQVNVRPRSPGRSIVPDPFHVPIATIGDGVRLGSAKIAQNRFATFWRDGDGSDGVHGDWEQVRRTRMRDHRLSTAGDADFAALAKVADERKPLIGKRACRTALSQHLSRDFVSPDVATHSSTSSDVSIISMIN